MMKSLRSNGSEQAARACCRNASLPWKKSLSVSTDRQAAPACWYLFAIAAGSKSTRITPLLGLAFFTSAITAGRPASIFASMAAANPRVSGCSAMRAVNSASGNRLRRSATSSALRVRMRLRMSVMASRSMGYGCILMRHAARRNSSAARRAPELLWRPGQSARDRHEGLHLRMGGAAGNRGARQLDAGADIVDHIGRIESGAGIQADDVMRHTMTPLQHVQQHRLRFVGACHLEVAAGRHRQAEILGLHLVFAHHAVAQLADHGGR